MCNRQMRLSLWAGAWAALPPYCPDLNPVERIWLYLRERFLSHRLLADLDAVMNACCHAWNALAADPNRVQSLTAYPYLRQVNA
jgi:transposase